MIDRVLPGGPAGQAAGALVLAAVAFPLICWAVTPVPLGPYILAAGVAVALQASYVWLAETGRLPPAVDRATLWATAGLIVLLTVALAWSLARRPHR